MSCLFTKALHIYHYDFAIIDVIDLVLVCLFISYCYRLIKDKAAVNILLGLAVIYILYFVIQACHLQIATLIMKKIIMVGPLVPVILFQREIRLYLSTIGARLLSGKDLFRSLIPWMAKDQKDVDVTPIVKAAQALGGSNTGALIVLTKNEDLTYYETSGDLINAVVSSRLLISIFNKHSPLHDGAVIIKENRITAARCVLPVTDDQKLPAHFGLRHKAAIGLTEITDTLVIVVSEESGQISIARQGEIASNLSLQEMRSRLKAYLI